VRSYRNGKVWCWDFSFPAFYLGISRERDNAITGSSGFALLERNFIYLKDKVVFAIMARLSISMYSIGSPCHPYPFNSNTFQHVYMASAFQIAISPLISVTEVSCNPVRVIRTQIPLSSNSQLLRYIHISLID
jgi:hypothetical protein